MRSDKTDRKLSQLTQWTANIYQRVWHFSRHSGIANFLPIVQFSYLQVRPKESQKNIIIDMTWMAAVVAS